MKTQIELQGRVTKIGNGAHVFVPKEFIGQEVSIILIERSLDINKEVFNILNPYLDDILGIYLIGSYARHEQNENSDIDIIAISNKTKKEIISGKYNIIITTLKSVVDSLEKNSILTAPRIMEAKTILNSSLLEELKSVKITKNSLKFFIDSTKSIIKINKKTLELDELQKENSSSGTIYSLILRLRGMLMVKCMLEKRAYSNKEFRKWIEKETGVDYEKIYEIYSGVKSGKKTNREIEVSEALKLLKLLEKELTKLERR